MLEGPHKAYQWYPEKDDHGQTDAIKQFIADYGAPPAYVAFKNTWLLPIPEPKPQQEGAEA